MSEVRGEWFDGRSSRAHEVRLGLAAPGVLFIEQVDGARQEWPIAAIDISARLGTTPRTLRVAGGQHVVCADTPLLDNWLTGRTSRVERAADWLERRRAAIGVAALGTLLACIGSVHVVLPEVASRLAARVPRSVEVHASDQAVALLTEMDLGASQLPPLRQEHLQRAFGKLLQGEPRAAELQLRFASGGDMGANAFALPDGRIYMTDELAELAGSDDEVLAVLAHEAGHHVHRHGMRQALESSSVFVLAGLLFGDVSGSSLTVALPAVLLSNRFSRAHEREADRYAFALLLRRGQSPAAFASVMQRLAANTPGDLDSSVVGYLSTHPPTPERIKAARDAADGPGRGP